MHKRFSCLNIAILLFITQICASCGSVQTLMPNSKYNLKHNKRYEKTNCNSIPRVYSGLSLDVCMAFLGPPALVYERNAEAVFYGYLVDMVLSTTIDTLVLPYTIIRQFEDGNLRLKRRAILNIKNKY